VRGKQHAIWLLAVALAALGPCLAGEYAIFKRGFQICADRHEVVGGSVRLFNGESFLEIPAAEVASFEADNHVDPPASPAGPEIARAPEPKPIEARDLVTRAALRNGLPPALLHSIAMVESAYRQDAVSPRGAVGIMQLMPQTARDLDADPTDMEQNVDAGARYLRQLLIKYMEDPYQLRKALAAYNAGPAAVDRYSGIPPYPETHRYVQRVLTLHRKLQDAQPSF
jgi:soluble lytic murein transglycosylase-like protein